MNLPVLFLRIVGVISVGFGALYGFDPSPMMTGSGFPELAPSAITEARAAYGGFQIGLGAFMLWASATPGRVGDGLLLSALVFGAIALCRSLGLALDGSLNGFQGSALAFESTFTGLSLWGWRRAPVPT